MADKIPMTRALGYIDVVAIADRSEWKEYVAAVGLKNKGIAKDKVRSILRDGFREVYADLANDARVDFVKLPDGRLQVWEDLSPPKPKKRGRDFSHLFKPKPRPSLK